MENNSSSHSNDGIRSSHRDNNVRIAGYSVTPVEKGVIKDLIHTQVVGDRREQDNKTQMVKQTRELDPRSPYSPDLDLIGVVRWSGRGW